MHQVEHYDLVISRGEEPNSREVLLLVVERDDVPATLGKPLGARWVQEDDTWALELSFEGQAQGCGNVRLASLSPALAEPLRAFDRLLVVWMNEYGVVGEEDIAVGA